MLKYICALIRKYTIVAVMATWLGNPIEGTSWSQGGHPRSGIQHSLQLPFGGESQVGGVTVDLARLRVFQLAAHKHARYSTRGAEQTARRENAELHFHARCAIMILDVSREVAGCLQDGNTILTTLRRCGARRLHRLSRAVGGAESARVAFSRNSPHGRRRGILSYRVCLRARE